MMSNALSSMWRGSESKLSQHCLKVRIQIPSHLRAYSQLWVTITSTIKLYTSNTQRHGAGILTWKAENGRRMGNQDWTKAVWEFSRAHTKPCSSVHVLSPGYTETSSEQQWGWEALILLDSLPLPFATHTHGPSLGQTSFGDFSFLGPPIILRFPLQFKVHPHSLTPAHSGERIRHLSSFHPTLLLSGIWRCNHSHHIDTELIAKPSSGGSVPHEWQFNLDSLLQLV